MSVAALSFMEVPSMRIVFSDSFAKRRRRRRKKKKKYIYIYIYIHTHTYIMWQDE